MEGVLAVVLAGGRGKRMDILCNVRPKPALSFAGGLRVIDFSLSNCIQSGIADIAVLTDYHRVLMAEYLNQWKTANAERVNFYILEPGQGCYKGTADAVYQNLEHLRKSEADLVLVLAGDHVYKMDYRKMVSFHRETKAEVSIGVVSMPAEQMFRFGTITTGADNRIIEFIEKSPNPRSNLASMGIYVFNKKVLVERLTEDAAKPDSPHDFGYAIIPETVRRDRVLAYQFQDYWQDIGSKDVYYAASMELISNNPAFSLESRWNVLSGRKDTAPIQRVNQGNIENSLIGPGCIIKGRVQNSILSDGVRVEDKAIVLDSILMAGVNVGYRSVVHRCILDECVSIGQYCYIGFGVNLWSVEQDITVIGKGAAVPNNTAVGRNCTIMPDVEASDFNHGVVPSGTTVSSHSARGATQSEQVLVTKG